LGDKPTIMLHKQNQLQKCNEVFCLWQM